MDTKKDTATLPPANKPTKEELLSILLTSDGKGRERKRQALEELIKIRMYERVLEEHPWLRAFDKQAN